MWTSFLLCPGAPSIPPLHIGSHDLAVCAPHEAHPTANHASSNLPPVLRWVQMLGTPQGGNETKIFARFNERELFMFYCTVRELSPRVLGWRMKTMVPVIPREIIWLAGRTSADVYESRKQNLQSCNALFLIITHKMLNRIIWGKKVKRKNKVGGGGLGRRAT